jgi:hypothetical protein
MIKNIQKRIMSEDYETMIYAAVLIPLIGIVIVSLLRSAALF